ncbi:MAG: DEAD/DEAH box helicase, partial [Alphaproteobacteria bacterium]
MDYKIKLKNITSSTTLIKVPSDSLGFLASMISHNFSNHDKIFIAQNDAEINILNQQIKFFLPEQKIINFYGFDCSPYDKISPKPQILASRIKALYDIINRQPNENFFLITSVNSLIQKTITPEIVKNLGLSIKAKTKYSLSQVVDFLIAKGYERMSNANNVGEFAVRGGIVDVVIMQASDLLGYRIDFFGDEIESIKIFDPITQLSYENVKSFEVLPASEVILNQQTIANFREKYRKLFGSAIDDQFYQAISEGRTFDGMEHWLPLFYQQDLTSILDFLKNPIIFHQSNLMSQINLRNQEILELYQSRLDHKKSSLNFYNPIRPELMYFLQSEIADKIQKNIAINFSLGDIDETQQKNLRVIDLNGKIVPDFALASRANKKDVLEVFGDFLQNYRQKKVAIAILSEGFKDRLTRYFHDYNIALEFVDNFADFNKIKFGKIASFILPMNLGFEFDDFIIIGEQAIFGEKLLRQKISKSASRRILEESLSINQGDLVVHRDHGIGKFDGIQTITALGIKTDMIKIIYGGGDNLFVPVDNINLITRYGAENPLIQLDRLGVASFRNRCENVRKKIRVTAEELLKISAERQLKKAKIYIPETFFYDEFKAKFGFVETQDQMKAIDEVEEDLQKGSPMDRLICGDVGFGKTEVAIRASAIVAKHSQVAIIAPTTILVRQHFKNFIQRFAHTDIKIAQLSRMVSSNEAKKIRDEIADGSIKIIIGTHALLQKSIKFADLGLLIIDEEQHFGVAQKELLKKMRNNIHVLTLSATPIPRTLQMSLAGVRDLSLIATPPIDRIAVRNFVMTYDSVIVKEAIMREYNRSGKVFFVVPRVKDIEEME